MQNVLQKVAQLETLFSNEEWQKVEQLNGELLTCLKDMLDGRQGITEEERGQLEIILARYNTLINTSQLQRKAAGKEIAGLNRAEKCSGQYMRVCHSA